MLHTAFFAGLLGLFGCASACDNCYGPSDLLQHPRHTHRMQPEALNATSLPTRPLEWGQLNFLHTTDTHGWLEGHLKEQNYGADWGDFVSFTAHLKQKADDLDVDLLLIDTGDLHDGNGLSDATTPDGVLSNPIFENVNYDVLTIGNHELYLANVAYETFFNFSTFYGDKYITSNVQILNSATGQYQYIGQQYRYFTTQHGLRIMAFGVLYDFTGNTIVTKVTKAADLVKQPWFTSAINYSQPIDLFLVAGHNPIRPTAGGSTFGTLYNAIKKVRPNVPIQAFGGHSHIRDFVVFDSMSTGIESGRYCETLGFLSLSGIQSSNSTAVMQPKGVPNPTTRAVSVGSSTATTSAGFPSSTTNTSHSSLVYSRRYLDWNRATFAYHATGSQDSTFDTSSGLGVSSDITAIRKELNLTALYGCAPETYCFSCRPYGADGNIFSSLLPTALGAEVINTTRSTIPRFIIINTGSIRFDLVQGPFTYDDSFIVSPFTDGFQYIANVPYATASQVLGKLDSEPGDGKRDLQGSNFNFRSLTGDVCPDASLDAMFSDDILRPRSLIRGLHRRQSSTTLTPGYSTKDDFGDDGDDTPHSPLPYYPQPDYIQGNGSFPTDGSSPAAVDLIFLDFFADDVLTILTGLGAEYSTADVTYYLDPKAFTTQTYLPAYTKQFWQANVPNCPTGQGVTK
ncbi:hypothetical protein ACLMJK_004488 [Lecanora helva]